MDNSLISVVMPSYNTPNEYLREAVNSVLKQTYTNFELLIIDDGSRIPVKKSLGDISDPRIRILSNPGNKGLPYTLNSGIENSRGKYIFRMDSDDICKKDRFERQVEFLENNPDIDVVATFAQTFGDKDVLYYSPVEDSQIKAGFLWKNELVHPTIALRGETVRNKNIRYRENAVSEDYEIWTRMAFELDCKFAVIPEALINYRIHEKQVTVTNSLNLGKDELVIIRNVFSRLKLNIPDEQIVLYNRIRINDKMTSKELSGAFAVMKLILSRLPKAINRQYLKKLYRKQALKYCLKNKRFCAIFKIVGIR